MERTFVCIKPESVRRCLVGKIVERFEANGFRLIAIKMLVPSRKQAADHYIGCSNEPYFPKVISYMTSGPVIAMIWEGVDVVRGIRKVLGATPDKIPPPGTLRSDYRNNSDVGKYHDTVCHGSDSADDARREIVIWFDKDEVPPHSRVLG
uniref:Nucleoside diphosphate kinase n=1 Tax=Globodera rostochiensis TaxID=31243 RepID=A0A914H3I5_GLORO